MSSEPANEKRLKTINLPDLSQPPPPLLYKSLAAAPPPPPPNPPPLPPLPPQPVPPPSDLEKISLPTKIVSEKEKARERSRRGLPNLREKHVCGEFGHFFKTFFGPLSFFGSQRNTNW
jgi:hypothetical protein